MNYIRMKFIKIKEHLFPSNPNLPDNVKIPPYQSRKYSREQRDWRRGSTLRLYRNREKDEANNKDKQEERETRETERAERLHKQWNKGPPKRPFGINVPKDKQWKIAAKKARDAERQDKLRTQRRSTITEYVGSQESMTSQPGLTISWVWWLNGLKRPHFMACMLEVAGSSLSHALLFWWTIYFK